MEFTGLVLPNEIILIVEEFEPNSRWYTMQNKPDHITVWNKHATNREIKYGCLCRSFRELVR